MLNKYLINAVTGEVGTGTNLSGFPTNQALTSELPVTRTQCLMWPVSDVNRRN